MREKAVRELLTRHCQLLETPESWAKETFLTQKLCVPAEWIHEAKAVRAHVESSRHLEALYLFKAGHWNHCHKLVIRHLASGECFILRPVCPGVTQILPTWTPWQVRPEVMVSMERGRHESDHALWKLSVQAWLGQNEGLERRGRWQYCYVIIHQEYSWCVLIMLSFVYLGNFIQQHQKYLFGELKPDILHTIFRECQNIYLKFSNLTQKYFPFFPILDFCHVLPLGIFGNHILVRT